MPEPDTTPEEEAPRLFSSPCRFIISAANPQQLPPTDRPEVAFWGRSNVGKSSLINALVGRKALARTSGQPGRTQQINLFDLAGRLYLADLPGYGYAKAPRSTAKNWQRASRAYLRGRPNLQRVFLLVDSRHGFKPIDLEVMALMGEAAVSFMVLLSKIDKLPPDALKAVAEESQKPLGSFAAAFPGLGLTSARRGDGLRELRRHIANLALEVRDRHGKN